jgi:predicted nucleotidyltransferase
MAQAEQIIRTVLKHYPETQAVYLFGTFGTDRQFPGSDVDIALLFPHQQAGIIGTLAMTDLRFELERLLKMDVDLINLRRAPTVLQKEIIIADRRIYTADKYAADEFDMLTISYYQKLNEERAEILEAIMTSQRVIQP